MMTRFFVRNLMLFLMLMFAVKTYCQTPHEVALRTVADDPNWYLTVDGPCGPKVRLNKRAGENENEVDGRQIFTILDLNDGKLEWGDRVRIKICRNYLRVNSERGLDSAPPLNRDASPDSATVFTLVKPPDKKLNAQPDTFIVLKDENGRYVSAPNKAGNGLYQNLTSSNDLNKRSVLKVISNPVLPLVLKGYGPYEGPSGFDRGMQTTRYCGKQPESWIRGSVALDRSSRTVKLTIQLETDSVSAGPKGKVLVTVQDLNGNSIATLSTDELGRGGKLPGRAAIETFQSTKSLPPESVRNARSLLVQAQCTGSIDRWFNIKLDDLQHAFEIAVAIFGGNDSNKSPR